MDTIALPKMREISVSPDDLILDPNNPRLMLIAGDGDGVLEEAASSPGIVEKTKLRLSGGDKDRFRIRQLEESILQNGWQPIDAIFVKLHQKSGGYLVLEGNRRVTAIRSLLGKDDTPEQLCKVLEKIDVMEVLDEDTPEKLQMKIAYLLGIRHHGSLHIWSPFAQAHNIYIHYLRRSEQDDESFQWNETVAKKIAFSLSLQLKDVKERLKVFRVMQQLGNSKKIMEAEPEGGMKDSYYSICKGGLLSNKKEIGRFIKQDQITFLLDDDAFDFRVGNLLTAP